MKKKRNSYLTNVFFINLSYACEFKEQKVLVSPATHSAAKPIALASLRIKARGSYLRTRGHLPRRAMQPLFREFTLNCLEGEKHKLECFDRCFKNLVTLVRLGKSVQERPEAILRTV